MDKSFISPRRMARSPGIIAWALAAAISGLAAGCSLDLAEVGRNAAVADYERTIQTASRDVADALSAQHWLAEQLAIQRRALLSSRVSLYAALGGGSQHYGEPPPPTSQYQAQKMTP